MPCVRPCFQFFPTVLRPEAGAGRRTGEAIKKAVLFESFLIDRRWRNQIEGIEGSIHFNLFIIRSAGTAPAEAAEAAEAAAAAARSARVRQKGAAAMQHAAHS